MSLPRPRTRFVGRRRSLARIRGLLEEHRLVTLTGVGGSGKTRLALQVAGEAEPGLADRVGWIGLAALDDPRLVASTACSSLGIRVGSGRLPVESLAARLGSDRWLVVLDNCEHLVDACAELSAEILDRCPELRILATSREALGLSGEVTWPVTSLRLPEADGPPERLLEEARRSGSVRLFTDRARAVRPDFELTTANVEPVVRLCRRLDGIPLALELAAARLRVLGVEQIVERLDHDAGVLRQPGREAPSRHRTMRAALSWSHELLGEPERALFRRLGAFGGDFSMDACEAACAGGAVERAGILDVLTRLVDKSMVVVDEGADVVRYRLLEPVRRFAVDELEASGERETTRHRHAAYFVDLAEEISPALRGPDRPVALRRMEAEHDNLRRAWDHAAETEDGGLLARLGRALFWFWNFGGHFQEGRTRSEEGLDDLSPGSEGRPDLQWVAGALAWMQGDYEVAGSRLEACAAGCRRAGRDDLLPMALRELAGVHLVLGEMADGVERAEDAVARLRGSDRAWDLGLALILLADIRDGLGEPGSARKLRQEARDVFGDVGDPWGLSLAHLGLGLAAARKGDLDDARAHGRKALARQRAVGDEWNVGQVLALLGEIEERAGREERAGELLGEALEAFRQVGDRTSVVHCIRSLAMVEGRRGRTLRAVRLAGAARARAEGLEGSYPYALATDDEHDELLEELRQRAQEDAFAEEWAAGAALDLDEAVALALDLPGASRRDLPSPAGEGSSPRVRIYALGPPDVYRGRRRLRPGDWTYALPEELFFYLLVCGPRTKEQIGLDFWPEASSDQLRGRFRTALYQLRRALGGTHWVRYENGRYDVDRSLDYWFDVEAFETAVDAGSRLADSDPEGAADHFQRAVDLYRGEFLEAEGMGRWTTSHRERLRRRYVEALLALGDLRATAGAHESAADLYRRAVECNELHEEAHRLLALSLARAGDPAAALRTLSELEELFRSELGAEVSEETLDLRSRLKQGREI